MQIKTPIYGVGKDWPKPAYSNGDERIGSVSGIIQRAGIRQGRLSVVYNWTMQSVGLVPPYSHSC
jgi:hypothetical protein